ncbi:hypothetical protein E7X58_31910 [Streptomyces sp. A1499]|nr:hypothetical protein E7X58_31910 [Streptomyces sp. A1499]
MHQPPAFDRETCKQRKRNTVERRLNRLKQWRGIATRYEKTATIHLAGLRVAGTSSGPPADVGKVCGADVDRCAHCQTLLAAPLP